MLSLRTIALGLFSALAAHASTALEGRFSLNHTVAMLAYGDQASCEANRFTWIDDLCNADGEDSAEITNVGGELKLEILTVTTNTHNCDFSASAQKVSDTEIRAVSQGCEVTVIYTTPDSVNVTAGGQCDAFCGVNATLDITGAKRKP